MNMRPRVVDPVIVHQCWVNRRHDALVVRLATFNDINIVDIRKHAMNKAGQLVPTPKGIALKVTRLPDLLKAITKALSMAKELGLVDEGAAE